MRGDDVAKDHFVRRTEDDRIKESRNIMRKTILINVLAGLGLVFVGSCGSEVQKSEEEQEPSPQPAVNTYPVRGIVKRVSPANLTVVIHHETIPGFMPEMAMPFYLKDAETAESLHPGDAVSFSFYVTPTNSWAADFQKIDSQEVNLSERPEPASTGNSPSTVQRVEEGDSIPEFELISTSEERIARSDLLGKPILLTFIFTRCPVPDFCPLMMNHFKVIHDRLQKAGLADAANLVSITIDPEYDTPEILRGYKGGVVGGDFPNWYFLTGTPSQIERLTKAFRVYVEEDKQTINHGLCTVLARPDGTITRIWRGNRWEPDAVMEELSAMLSPLKLQSDSRQ